ncbi:MAG: DUF4417 domain-containing protein, partial [Anaerolineae bacterium]|nr:DUF4417 domain-containing protein [Anaerolineae bacterium]
QGHVLMTRTSHRWQSKPGRFDALHALELFPSDNALGIPCLAHVPVERVPRWLAPYRTRIRANEPPDDGAVHFFMDDYRFETVWSRPRKALEALAPYTTVLSPDFSLYRDWPLMLQMWNVYRNRWCGAFWQSQGFTVIPTVSWSTAESYDFCFLGLPRRSVVAVSAVGVRLDDAHPADGMLEGYLFREGFREMVVRLAPAVVLAYGRLPAGCGELVEVVEYPTRWEGIRQARKRRHG